MVPSPLADSPVLACATVTVAWHLAASGLTGAADGEMRGVRWSGQGCLVEMASLWRSWLDFAGKGAASVAASGAREADGVGGESGTLVAITLVRTRSEEEKMIEFMRDGGWGMWAILIAGIATVAITVTRSPDRRVAALTGGCIAVLMAGMLGMATGMVAVSRGYLKFPDKVDAVAQGLGELSNNGTFAAMIVAGLGLAAMVLSFKNKQPKTA